MTRIVAGTAGGRRLAVPTTGTRPTSDRVREAVFSTVASRLELDGTRVLDLYAGSGALGLEALSRGAAHARFVESDRRAGAVLRRNVVELGLAGAEVDIATVGAVLSRAPARPYDLVFADPPYALGGDDLDAVLAAVVTGGWASPGALLVVERSARTPPPGWPTGVAPLTSRRYGETVVHYGFAP